MKRNCKISVAMATYNGGKYIKEQLDSIIKQLDKNDEIIISDDGSTDNTIDIIKSYNDKRIKLFDGMHDGVKSNFANAINKCTGEYIFLCDQDDVWLDNKVEVILNIFDKKKCTCILHDCEIFNSNNNKVIIPSFMNYRRSKKGIINNIIRNSYIGCCMCFKSSIKDKILPIPNNIEMHDQWIGILCEEYGSVEFLKDVLIRYRRHGNNVSSLKHYPLTRMIKNRVNLIINLIFRKAKYGKSSSFDVYI